MNRLVLSALAAAALLGLSACGGSSGGGSQPAGLTYTNPAYADSDYRLVKDNASTASVLILDLVGPSGNPAVGVTYGFTVDTSRAAWGTAPAVTNGTVFVGTNALVQGWVSGAQLQGIAANKGLANFVQDVGVGVIAKIRLTPGTASGSASLADAGLGTSMDQGGTPIPIKIKVGTVTNH
jgi:hypothetical protein